MYAMLVLLFVSLQLTDQVQRINTKLQASLTTLAQASPSAVAPPNANGSTSSNGDAAAAAAAAARGKIDKMSAEVVDSNPYSRLMALQRMGIVENYEKIREKTVSGVLTGVVRAGEGGGEVLSATQLAGCWLRSK
jgi:ubiquitin-like modifier-activating enzyme 5